MFFEHIDLRNFRNFARLNLDLRKGVTVIVGSNGQGKSNLLEALYVAATTRSFRARSDRELVNWDSHLDAEPFARVDGRARRDLKLTRVEVIIAVDTSSNQSVGSASTGLSKRIRLNGAPKKAIEVIGQVRVVMFTPSDIDLVTGGPAQRRRYLDITISQADPSYVRTLARYNQVLVHRNHLLRRIRDNLAGVGQLEFWDREMCDCGSYLLLKRLEATLALQRLARDYLGRLTDDTESLELNYRNSLDVEVAGSLGRRIAEVTAAVDSPEEQQGVIRQVMRRRLHELCGREVNAGLSVVGPHRDDVQFTLNGREASLYASRGQQRSIALCVRLAEIGYLQQGAGSPPVVLLDDVLSELDERRRDRLLQLCSEVEQVIITTADAAVLPSSCWSTADIVTVANGVVVPTASRETGSVALT